MISTENTIEIALKSLPIISHRSPHPSRSVALHQNQTEGREYEFRWSWIFFVMEI